MPRGSCTDGSARVMKLEDALQRTNFDVQNYFFYNEDGRFAYFCPDLDKSGGSAKSLAVPLSVYKVAGKPEHTKGADLRRAYETITSS